jgi:hypothetical protein
MRYNLVLAQLISCITNTLTYQYFTLLNVVKLYSILPLRSVSNEVSFSIGPTCQLRLWKKTNGSLLLKRQFRPLIDFTPETNLEETLGRHHSEVHHLQIQPPGGSIGQRLLFNFYSANSTLKVVLCRVFNSMFGHIARYCMSRTCHTCTII